MPRFVKPWLEVLEDRLVLDAYVFAPNIPLGGDGVNWNNPFNWVDTTNPPNISVPGPTDDAAIPTGFDVVLGGASATVNSLGLGTGSSLTVNSSLEANGIATDPGSLFKVTTDPSTLQPAEVKIDQSATFSGSVIDAGRMIANTTNPNTGTSVTFAGGAVIGPGDLNGNLDAGPNSSFTFTSTGEFVSGATLGPGTGSVIIAAAVAVDGALQDNTMAMNLVPGGSIGGAGSIDEWANFTWTGGTISLTGGITIEPTSAFKTDGAADKFLDSDLTNISPFTELDGTGSLRITSGATFHNVAGTVELSLPAITFDSTSGGTFINDADATLDITAVPFSAINTNFINNGTIHVDDGCQLDLNLALRSSGVVFDLDGTLQLDGNLVLFRTVSSPTGFVEEAGTGKLIVAGSARLFSTLIVPSGAVVVMSGNVEVQGTLTGGGLLNNSGVLTLDLGSTATIGSYQQSSIGTLEEHASSPGVNSKLIVSGDAQLSGTLKMDFDGGYTPKSGDTFTVMTAGEIDAHFDTIPDGMTATYGPNSVSVTKN